jgi:hypothetical protein
MPYRLIARKHADGSETIIERGKRSDGLERLSYRDLQQAAISLGISGKQTAEALKAAIRKAENAQ